MICWYGREPVERISVKDVLDIPGIWFFLHSFLYVVLLFQPQKKLYQTDMATVRMGTRHTWWKGIILWMAESEICYYSIFLCSIGLTNLNRISMNWQPHSYDELQGFSEVFPGVGGLDFKAGYMIFWLRVLLLPILVGFTVHLLQVTLSLFFRFEVSILISFAYLLMAVYGKQWYLIGNGTMLVRSELAGYPGQTIRILILCCILIGLLYLIGLRRVRTMDILQKRRI